MSSYTPSELPFEVRQYRCESHPVFEDPSRCSTCEYNRRQRQLDRERGQSVRGVIDQATRDHGSASGHRHLQQDVARSRSNYYGELRSNARAPGYGGSGGAGESYYRSNRDTGYGGAFPTRSISFRDPFESSSYGEPNRHGDLIFDNSASSNPTTVQYANRPPPNNRDLDSMGPRGRRNGLSGNSGGGWSTSQCPQQ